MAVVAGFTFNPFQENTYVIYDDTKKCIIIDPGCFNEEENGILSDFIEKKQLKPVRLINTHCHVDHVLGNGFVAKRYGLELEIHKGEEAVLKFLPQMAMFYGIRYEESPNPGRYISPGETISFGNTALKVLFTPGHSPASICLFCEADKFVVAGDVLFQMSIGRTDLPGGDYDTLIASIRNEILPLGDEVVVYPGHGPSTTVGEEKTNNPFLNK